MIPRSWQDWVFSIGEVVFIVTTLPLLWEHTVVAKSTEYATAVCLYAFSGCQLSYRNMMTFWLGLPIATIWLLLGLGVHL